MPTWPSILPEPNPGGYQETPQSQVLRSDMDAGPPKARRRFTAGTRTVPVQYTLDEEQASAFEAFFYGEISAGAMPFDWTHPRTEEQVVARVVPPYQIAPVNGGLWWLLSLTIEIQP